MILLAIPGVLAAIYYLSPQSFQQSLVLDHTKPRIHNFWTNALAHEHRPEDGHLIGNSVGYLLLVFPCWILYRYRDQERKFWTGLAIILTIGPFIVSASSYITFYEILGLLIENDRGFSGVVSALAGFLLVSIVFVFAEEQEESVAILSTGLYFGCVMLGLGVLTRRITAIGLGLLVLIVIFAGTRTRYVARAAELADWGREHPPLSVVLVIAILVSVLGFAASLPADITSGDGLTNIVAHGTGFVFGMLVAGSFGYRKRQSSAEGSAAA